MARKKALKRVSSNVDPIIWIREKTTFIDKNQQSILQPSILHFFC